MYIIIWRGKVYIGPFDNEEAAKNYAAKYIDDLSNLEIEIVKLSDPEEA